MSSPIFCVVGHVNKGKSSVVSTLTEDDSVHITPEAGTTRTCRRFPVRVNDHELFVLVDTPGFEEARAALDWMRTYHETGPSRREAVLAFVEAFHDSDRFREECQLLTPLLDGAGILYVVDGSEPFRSRHRAEMEILRWTARPRMALINEKGLPEHVEAWRGELDGYFNIVRRFNAHRVVFHERIGLLRGMRELSEDWAAALDTAIDALEDERRWRRERTARILARQLFESLTLILEEPLGADGDTRKPRTKLMERFHCRLRAIEARTRRDVETLYRHRALERREDELERPVWDQDLFAQSSWKMYGLTPTQVLAMGAVGGAAAGGVLDAGLLGSSFLTGTVLGAIAGGGGAAWVAGRRLESVRNLRRYLRGDDLLRIGPHQSPDFPFVLLDRALLHWQAVRNRAHAVRDQLELGEMGIVSELPAENRRQLGRVFASLRRSAPQIPPAAPRLLHEALLPILDPAD